MRTKLRVLLTSMLCAVLLCSGMTGYASDAVHRGNRYIGVNYKPWDVTAASAAVNNPGKRKMTIMVYMNGSDLESENGAATEDLVEMLESNVNTDDVNIILFTGGTNRWQNDVIPENNCMVWRLVEGGLEELAGVGLVNMGNAGTLASFLRFSLDNFPAERYGLIMWDHGGGSIAGYGHDEKFDNSALTLLEMGYAFQKAGLADNKLEFLGFDSCLMASVEMASIASDYAHYLIASEDLEPGEGWDYTFLSALNQNPSMDGAALGKVIVDYFMDYYGPASDEVLTLSVTDLSKANEVMDAMGDLKALCSDSLLRSKTPAFSVFARKRYGTKTFGGGSPRDNDCDMVDIADMANQYIDLFPVEAARIHEALDRCVVYNRHNSDANLKGLSAYYIYGGKDLAGIALPTYAALDLNAQYTDYLHDFAYILNDSGTTARRTRSNPPGQPGNILPPAEDLAKADLSLWQPVPGKKNCHIMTGLQTGVVVGPDGSWEATPGALWPTLDGKPLCLYEISHAGDHVLYAAPAMRNGRRCDIVVALGASLPNGKILGARQEDGLVIQKGYDKIKNGDNLSLLYQERSVNKDGVETYGWYPGDPFTVQGELALGWAVPNGETYAALRLTDIWHNEYFTGMSSILSKS